MNAAGINAKIYAGRSKVALRLGVDYVVYRPNQAANPLSNQIATIKAAFNAGDSSYKSPNMPGDAYWYGDFDGRITQPGDYMIHTANPSDMKFIAAQQSLLPIVLVDCNTYVRVVRQAPTSAVGAVGYGGAVAANEVPVLGAVDSMWPASILQQGKQRAGLDLPSGAVQAGWRILLPPSVPAPILAADMVVDANGRRFLVNAAETTEMGWRINATEVHT